ncbi:MAG: hypothetical protein WA952_04540 [Lewinella sp.]
MSNHPILLLCSTLLCLSFFSCGGEGEQVFAKAESIFASRSLLDEDSLHHHFNANTVEFLTEVGELTAANNIPGLEALGERNQCPITTVLLGQAIQRIFSDSAENISASNVIVLMSLMDLGVFRNSEDLALKPYEIGSVDENVATVKVTVPTGYDNTKILTEYTFNKEEEKWKLDLPSTLKFHDNLFRKLNKKQGLPIPVFAEQYLDSESSTIQFRYRSQ